MTTGFSGSGAPRRTYACSSSNETPVYPASESARICASNCSGDTISLFVTSSDRWWYMRMGTCVLISSAESAAGDRTFRK